MDQIREIMKEDASMKHLLNALKKGKNSIYLHGLIPESLGHFLVYLLDLVNRPIFLVSERSQEAYDLQESIQGLAADKVEYYPELESNFFNIDSISANVKGQRIKVMDRLLKKDNIIISTTFSALKRRLSNPNHFEDNALEIELGQDIELEDFNQKLFSMRYERTTNVEHRGQYAIRGGIVDIFPLFGDRPIRIEFFDTEVDSIRSFDVSSQRSIDSLDRVEIKAAEELQFDVKATENILKSLSLDLDAYQAKNQASQNAIRAGDKFSRIITHLEDGNRIGNDDLVSAYLPKEESSSILDYLPDNVLIIFNDFARINEYELDKERANHEDYVQLFNQGEVLAQHKNTFYSYQDLLARIKGLNYINISQLLKSLPVLETDEIISIKSVEAESFRKRWKEFCQYLKQKRSQNFHIYIYAGKNADHLKNQLYDAGLASQIIDKEDENEEAGAIHLVQQTYPKGFQYLDMKLLILTNYEIRGKAKKSSRLKKKKKEKNFLDYQDLVQGDYVVHENYGIGEYQGTKSIEIQGVTKDFLQIKYRASDVLYVSTDEMDLVAKYVGNSGKAPKLSSLGSKEWSNSKARVQKSIDAIADELVELYATRSKIEGYAFSQDTPWQEDFEASFPYEETPSQLRAISEIKEDMEKSVPMDRLLCGDVGYGKTEVALRAAFKAIMDGKQIAFLCPTTILTQQHYNTMVERFQDYPIRVEFLSRFKSPAQQKEIIDKLAKGQIDAIVGTHRLLSKDIVFKDLGLLIIDEEQRFGVKDKEKIKMMKENVDVLTLSATPIPRTLQLSLTGIRDMSLLEEPPEERYPTTTYVLEYDSHIIQSALLRELDRGGQVYFVYNRVYDIEKMYTHLRDLVPQARIGIGHGKMSTKDLENVMNDFVNHDIDILLSTTIIETGMDIPNANTMVVYNSDKMGLSQLYQLKGRIGRSNRKSYAFFTYEANKVLTESSEKRLKAIQDFTEFGSGYKIAMRDLELRGAGNILGESQSGQVESIGYDLYVKMLEDAVNKAKGIEAVRRIEEITVDIKVDAYIPDGYIPHSIDKISMYRKIASIEDASDYEEIVDELIDRYGDLPESVVNVMDVSLIRALATDTGFSKVTELKGYVELRYEDFDAFSIELLKEISENYRGPLTFDFQGEPAFKIESDPNKLKNTKNLLLLIKELQNQKKYWRRK